MNIPFPIRWPRSPAFSGQRARYAAPWLHFITRRLTRPSSLFWLCWVAILVGIALRYPSLTIHAEMFAENGTNLYYHAKHSGIWENLLEFQYYEYLIWFPRLIAIIAVKTIGLRESYAVVTEWTGHVVTGFFYAFFCLTRFRRILRSDLARFVVATALGVGLLGTYELYTFVNFPYHGMFLMMILLFSSLDSRPLPEVIVLTGVVFLVATSKLHVVAFVPFYVACALRRRWIEPGENRPPTLVQSGHRPARPWTPPRKILDHSDFTHAGEFYPQVMGLEPGDTDRTAGETARLYLYGASWWEIDFIPSTAAPTAVAINASPAKPVIATGSPLPCRSPRWASDRLRINGSKTASRLPVPPPTACRLRRPRRAMRATIQSWLRTASVRRPATH